MKREKKKLTDTQKFWTLFFTLLAVGIIGVGIVYAVGTGVGKTKTKERMENVLAYMKNQCIRYDDIGAEEQTKSLVRLIDKTEELRRDFNVSREAIDHDFLQEYLDNQRLSGIIITDSNAGESFLYNTDGSTKEDWESVLKKVKEVENSPIKVYTERIVMNPGILLRLRSGCPGGQAGNHSVLSAPGGQHDRRHTPFGQNAFGRLRL